MLVVQENCKLRSYGFALRCDCLLKQMILHLLGQIAPYPNNSLAQSARKLLCNHAGSWIGGWHFCYSRRRTPTGLATIDEVKSEDCWIFSPGPHPLRVVF